MHKLPKAAERHVAAVTAASGMPVSCRMEGFTKTIYAIVMKVVSPARTSVRQSVRNAAKSKYSSARRIKEDMNYLTVAQTYVCALALLALPLAAADDAQLLAEFHKTKPEVSQVHVLQEQPLLVAVTGQRGTWERGELLGVFAQRGEQIVPISILPNEEFPIGVRIERQTSDSITFALADDYGVRSLNLKIFFDPKTYFPKRIVRFAPVRVRRIIMAAGTLTVTGNDGKQDFTAHERNGVWRVTAAPAIPPSPTPSLTSVAQVAPLPVSTLGQFEHARPEKAKRSAIAGAAQINEEIGPYQREGGKIWIGKTFYDAEGAVGVGDIGYFEPATDAWTFLHIPEMADWSASALLVESDAIWVGLLHKGEGAGDSGGLLLYDRTTRRATTIPLPDVIDKIIRVGKQVYCGTSGGFAVVEEGRARRLEFTPQLDGSYVITPVP
jgi:hypothetical protein